MIWAPQIAVILMLVWLVLVVVFNNRRLRRLPRTASSPSEIDLTLEFTACRFDTRVDRWDVHDDFVYADGVVFQPHGEPMCKPMMPFYIDANGRRIRMLITHVDFEFSRPNIFNWHAQDEASLVKYHTITLEDS